MRSLVRAVGLTIGIVRVAGGQTPAERPAVAYVIPQQQPDQAALKTFLQVLTERGVELHRALAPFASGNVRYSAGTYVVRGAPAGATAAAALLEPRHAGTTGRALAPGDTTPPELAMLLGVGIAPIRDSFPVPVTAPVTPAPPRYVTPAGLGSTASRAVALYVPIESSRPVSWTRGTLERYGVVYAPIDSGALGAGDALRSRFDVVLLPDAGAAPYAALTDAAAAGLQRFIENGGTLVAIGSAARWAVRALRLPGRFDDLPPTDAPAGTADSAIVRVRIDRHSPIAADMVAHAAAWVAGGPGTVFAPDTGHAAIAATYDGASVVTGSADVGRSYDGRAAVIDVPEGRGRVVLFEFDPTYRGVSLATLPLLWGALRARGEP
jgi:hypothetical protein